MNDFLNSVKDDLLDVRLRLVVLLLGVALVAAVAYAVLGGGGSGSTATGSIGSVASGVAGISISQAPSNTTEPVTETTDGAVQQRHGPLRDPFTPLPSPTTAAAKTSTPATSSPSSSSSSSASGGSSTPGSKTTAPAATPKASAPEKTKVTTRYEVTVQFGVLPAPSIEGTPTAPAQLKTYSDLHLNEPLPDKTNPQLVYVGALKHTYLEAVFTLTGESILHGAATCVPSTTQCQAIRLQVGQTETLESIDASGAPVTYELRIQSILRITKTVAAGTAHSASVTAASKAGLELLKRKGLQTLSGLEYSPAKGLLVPTASASAAPRAHTAVRRPRHGR